MRTQLEEIAASVPAAFSGVEVLRTLLRREGRTQVMSLIVDR